MKHHPLIIAVSLGCGTLHAQSARQLDPMFVEAARDTSPWASTSATVDHAFQTGPDTAASIARLPGAAVSRNGSQTGILQVRGLSGDRVSIQIDGMHITPACPNHMDPPLHYAQTCTGDQLKLYAGISPVSEGGDQIGGVLSLERPSPVFASDGTPLLTRGTVRASHTGSHNTFGASADATLATGDLSLTYRGSAATADNLRIPGGTAADTSYDTMDHQVEGAWRTSTGFLALAFGTTNTRDAGTPALPMDMVRDDAWHLNLRHHHRQAWGTLDSRLYYHDTDHTMDNHSLRSVAPGSMSMRAPSTSSDLGWKSDLTMPIGDQTLRTGVSLRHSTLDARQIATATGLVRDTFQDNARDTAGIYLDWESPLGDGFSLRSGIRGDIVRTRAHRVDNAILPAMGPMRAMLLADQAAFNAADRDQSDLLPAATAALRYQPDERNRLDLAFALKSRAPSLIERYLWTPLNASAGLADGRTYLGNPTLDPETSFEIALGASHRDDTWECSITPYIQWIDDYIQGSPIARNDSAGKPVLQFQNTNSTRIYGLELAGNVKLAPDLSLAANAQYTRGDNSLGDLYRMAPLSGLVALEYSPGPWQATLECQWAAQQNHVLDLVNESKSPGYAAFHLRLARSFGESLRIEAGIENLLDHRYAEHLSGTNRVAAGDVPVGSRIPAAGRFIYSSISYSF